MCVGPVPLDILGGATKAAGQKYAGEVEKQVAYMNADIAEKNAAYAQQQASDAIDLGSDQVSQQYLKAGLMKGQQEAAQAANGVELGFGSPLEVVAGTATMAEIDANTLRTRAKQQGDAYRVQQLNYLNQAATYRLNGTAAQYAGNIGALGTALSTASQVGTDVVNAFMGGH